jgi:ribonuclease BN (tRNA processing enzyme)
MWVDAGSGTLANLQRHLAVDAVDGVVLSHEHPDHWSDLEGYLNVLRFVTAVEGLPVYAPGGLRARLYTPSEPYVAWHEVADGDGVSIGAIHVSFSRTDHGPETLAMRFDAGAGSLAYSADTGPGWSLEALGAGIDLALCEATVPTEKEGDVQHLSGRQAGESARDAKVGRLVLTHLWPTLDARVSRRDASEAFGADVQVAATGRRYVAGPGES